jgi:hypothetical protein
VGLLLYATVGAMSAGWPFAIAGVALLFVTFRLARRDATP